MSAKKQGLVQGEILLWLEGKMANPLIDKADFKDKIAFKGYQRKRNLACYDGRIVFG